jgi:hypothetical protein
MSIIIILTLAQPRPTPSTAVLPFHLSFHSLQFQAVDGGLHDAQGYVREAAVMGVLKCHHQDPAGVRMRGLLERVEALLASDTDPQVVANCLYVMQQVQSAVEMVVQSGSCIIKRARSVVGALMARGI